MLVLSASIAMAKVCNHRLDFMSFLPRIRLSTHQAKV